MMAGQTWHSFFRFHLMNGEEVTLCTDSPAVAAAVAGVDHGMRASYAFTPWMDRAADDAWVRLPGGEQARVNLVDVLWIERAERLI